MFSRPRSPGILQADFPWASLEPQPQTYDFTSVHEQLAFAKELGLSLVVSVSSLDSKLVSVPPDFAGKDPTQLRDGLHWNTTEVMDRYLVLLSKVMPVISQYGSVAHVSLGKEVDMNLFVHPSTLGEWAQLVATAQYLGRNASFFGEYTSVGFSLSFNGLMQVAGTEVLPVLLSIADSMPVTYYPRLGDSETVADPQVVVRDMIRFEAAMPESRCLTISNIGYPSGYNNASSVDNSTFAKQADFYGQAVAAIRFANSTRTGPFGQPRFKAVSFTNLADLPAEECFEYAKYNHESSPGFIENVCTIGIADESGKPKPAFAAFLDALKKQD